MEVNTTRYNPSFLRAVATRYYRLAAEAHSHPDARWRSLEGYLILIAQRTTAKAELMERLALAKGTS